MMVPIPASCLYVLTKATIKAQYDIMGVMMLVAESPIRYAACVSSGVNPSSMTIGTKIGAMMGHLAEALPMNRFINAAGIC